MCERIDFDSNALAVTGAIGDFRTLFEDCVGAVVLKPESPFFTRLRASCTVEPKRRCAYCHEPCDAPARRRNQASACLFSGVESGSCGMSRVMSANRRQTETPHIRTPITLSNGLLTANWEEGPNRHIRQSSSYSLRNQTRVSTIGNTGPGKKAAHTYLGRGRPEG
jgi:hypothetical protein